MKKIQKIHALGMNGNSCCLISVETNVKRGLFHFDIIGLANKSISESRQRILSAIQHSDPDPVRYSDKKIITLLSPSDIKKEGAHFDLPIAISYICSSKEYDLGGPESVNQTIFLGELSLTGYIRDTEQIVPYLISAIQSDINFTYVILPRVSFSKIIDLDISMYEPVLLNKIKNHLQQAHFLPLDDLGQFYEIVKRGSLLDSVTVRFHSFTNEKRRVEQELSTHPEYTDYLIDSMQGKETAKRALLIALSGNHHIIFSGPPGSGKSLLAKSSDELRYKGIDTYKNYANTHASYKNNFRQPHHSASIKEMLGDQNRTGEIALAHEGVLFLDELVEYTRRVIESLRQSIEYGFYQDSKGLRKNAKYLLIGTMNPCACGYHGSKERRCVCAQIQRERYDRKTHSPFFERIDMFIPITNEETGIHTRVKEEVDLKAEVIYKNTYKSVSRRTHSSQEYLSGEHIKRIVYFVHQFRKEARNTNTDNLKQQLEYVRDIEKNLSRESARVYIEIKRSYATYSKRWFSSLLKIADTISIVELCRKNGQNKQMGYKKHSILPEHILEALSYKQKFN